jgi:hypothetical protein
MAQMGDMIVDDDWEDEQENELLTLAKRGDWDNFVETIVQIKDPELFSNILFDLLWLINTPTSIIEFVVDISDREMASQRYYTGSTPLHEAIEADANKKVVGKLVSLYPEGVLCYDSEHQSPLDIICRKIIMQEERVKYTHDTSIFNYPTNSGSEDSLWECARLMLAALSGSNDDTFVPVLHAVVRAGPQCPESLRVRAFRKFKSQLVVADGTGNLPIHISAGIHPIDDVADDDLLRLIEASPETVMTKNTNNHLIPLQIAERSGRTWTTGICDLIRAKPHSIESLQMSLSTYPLVLRKCDCDIIFHILRGQPSLFASCWNTRTSVS